VFEALGDLMFAWKIILAVILIGWVYSQFGPGLLTSAAIVFLLWLFVLQNWGTFSLLYLGIMFFLAWQGMFFIQMVVGHHQQTKMMGKQEKEMEEQALQQMYAEQMQRAYAPQVRGPGGYGYY
jgi:predicted membrane protein